MQTILISLISDQTIPNILLIKELNGRFDQMVFISTSSMEKTGKSVWIEESAGIEKGSVPRLIVEENNWGDITRKLETYDWPAGSNFIVNQTGGTKVMTLAVFEFFSKPGNWIIYSSIGRNQYEELFPDRQAKAVAINYRLNLKEYLQGHGILYKYKIASRLPFEQLKTVFKKYRQCNYDINLLNDGYSGEWKNYYTGTWFEEYLYYKIRKDLNLNENAILMGVELMHFNQISRSGKDKELDIVFTFNNELYIAEAKVSIGRSGLKKDLLDQIMFKLSAINKHFGLRSHAMILTLADTNERSEIFNVDLMRKASVLGIEWIANRKEITNSNFSFHKLTKR
jgi:hypothetical protein